MRAEWGHPGAQLGYKGAESGQQHLSILRFRTRSFALHASWPVSQCARRSGRRPGKVAKECPFRGLEPLARLLGARQMCGIGSLKCGIGSVSHALPEPSVFRKVVRPGALEVPGITLAPYVSHLVSGAHKCGIGSPKCGMGSASHALPEPSVFRKVVRPGALEVPGITLAPYVSHLVSGAHKCGIGSPKCGMGSVSHAPPERSVFRKVVRHCALEVPGITSGPDTSHLVSGAHKCGIGSHLSLLACPSPALGNKLFQPSRAESGPVELSSSFLSHRPKSIPKVRNRVTEVRNGVMPLASGCAA